MGPRHRTCTAVSLLCPECRQPGATPRCSEHRLYRVEAEALADIDEAPLLGHALEDRYVLRRLLGGGGMGVVYSGLDLRLDRTVAVKTLHASLTATRQDRLRFEHEAKAMSRLRSNHTVTAFDFGVVGSGPLRGTAFIVMEQVEGESLAECIARGPLPPAQAATILDQVARSLDEAHALGIIHRDLKPQNILLAETPDGRVEAKVIDFGVARIEDAVRTRSGLLLGTPQYMAPEQCNAMRDAPLDARVDIYALGILLYEMLTGTRPFDARDPLAVVVKQLTTAPPRLPGAREDPTWAGLEAVVHRALAKDPADRPAGATRLSRQVHEALGVTSGAPMKAPIVAPLSPALGRSTTEAALGGSRERPSISARPVPGEDVAPPDPPTSVAPLMTDGPPGSERRADATLPLVSETTPPPAPAPTRPRRVAARPIQPKHLPGADAPTQPRATRPTAEAGAPDTAQMTGEALASLATLGRRGASWLPLVLGAITMTFLAIWALSTAADDSPSAAPLTVTALPPPPERASLRADAAPPADADVDVGPDAARPNDATPTADTQPEARPLAREPRAGRAVEDARRDSPSADVKRRRKAPTPPRRPTHEALFERAVDAAHRGDTAGATRHLRAALDAAPDVRKMQRRGWRDDALSRLASSNDEIRRLLGVSARPRPKTRTAPKPKPRPDAGQTRIERL